MLKSCLGSVSGLNNGDMGKCISEIPKLGTKYTKFPLINDSYLQQSLHIFEYCDQESSQLMLIIPTFLLLLVSLLKLFFHSVVQKSHAPQDCKLMRSVFIYLSFVQTAYIYCAALSCWALCQGHKGGVFHKIDSPCPHRAFTSLSFYTQLALLVK